MFVVIRTYVSHPFCFLCQPLFIANKNSNILQKIIFCLFVLNHFPIDTAMSGKKKKTKVANKPLPRYIRDELRMTCALKGYSSSKSGKSRRVPEQFAFMDKFFRGKAPSHPPQIKLLAEGHLNYREMYEEVDVTVKKKRLRNHLLLPPPN